MRKKQLFIILAALSISSLTGCHKDKTDPTEPTPLETIQPDTVSETISDKLDDPDTYKVPEAVYIIDGKELTEDEYKAYEESLQAEVEQPTDADGNNIPGGYSNPSVIVETNADGNIESYTIDESAALETEPEETLSEQEVTEIESGIDDFTYNQALEFNRISAKTEVAELRKTNPEFADITDEMIDNYSEDELDNLMQKIMKARGF